MTIAFRKWTKPTVKEGGTLLTAVGQLQILVVEPVRMAAITNKELLLAGYEERSDFEKEIIKKKDGNIYKIVFRLKGSDPRIALRNQSKVSTEELMTIISKLDKWDATGRYKHWTRKVLQLMNNQPGKSSVYYSQQLGYDRAWFKINVRKLKALGLTISLPDGYEISPRGRTVLKG